MSRLWIVLFALLVVGCPPGDDDDSAGDDDDSVANDDDSAGDDDDSVANDDDSAGDDDDSVANDDDSAGDDDDSVGDDDDSAGDDDDSAGDDDDSAGDDDDSAGDDDDSAGDDDDSATPCPDGDGDGVSLCGPDGVPGTADDDCNDTDPTVAPGVMELCDGLDTDCDGALAPAEIDTDGDGVSLCSGDCDAGDPTVYPGAPELCDGLDNDCDTVLPLDEADTDGDGVSLCGPDGVVGTADDDCDDTEPTVRPFLPELCDGLDNDCDGSLGADELDGDGDGVAACDGDCDAGNPTVYPGAPELCDGLDNDCDGFLGADELDGDGDGVTPCGPDELSGTADDDCDDADPASYPGAAEVCDGVDNDCDGVTPTSEADSDGDGSPACADCDDTDPAVSPLVVEGCGGVDVNCDGVAPPPCTTCSSAPLTTSADMCAATDWALALLQLSDCADAQQDFLTELDDLATCGCPTSTTSSTATTVPFWCAGVSSGYATVDTETWGACAATSSATGSLSFVEDHIDCGAGPFGYAADYVDTMSATAFDVVAPPACGASGLTGLGMDGLWERTYWHNQNLPPGTVNACTIDASFSVAGVLGSTSLADWLLPGTSDIERARSMSCINGSQGGPSPGIACNGSATIAATAHATTTPWIVTTNLSWYHDDGGGFWPSGCQDEPVSGSIVIELYDSPGGLLLSSLELAFDGNTVCDGCADVTLDGAPAGTWCSSLWEL